MSTVTYHVIEQEPLNHFCQSLVRIGQWVKHSLKISTFSKALFDYLHHQNQGKKTRFFISFCKLSYNFIPMH